MEEKIAKMAEGTFTEELIKEMESKKGLKLRVASHVFNEEATKGAIARFADGIGDSNPLWRDKEYAKNTTYKKIVAPPSWVYSVLAGVQFGWRGLAGFHSGSDMEFYLPILIDDKIKPEETFLYFDGPKESAFAGRLVIDYFEDKYFTKNEQLASKVIRWVIRTERKKAREKGKYKKIVLPHPWTDEELEKIMEETLAEEIRGNKPRYWEDVEIGEELKPVIKGPLGLTDMVAFIIGGGAPVKLDAHEITYQKYKKRPQWYFRDPISYMLEPIFAVHYNKSAAMAMGLPYPYDVGTQRHCWKIQLITNWMGDDGWLKRSKAKYKKFVFLSDVIKLTGKVIKKYINEEDCEYCVDIETHGFNQRGEDTISGLATVALPSKNLSKDDWPVAKRMKKLISGG